ncbi:MAG: AAA family ATPase [Treponema sp.]|nr:AAA family ATPase [Treponema sp.]
MTNPHDFEGNHSFTWIPFYMEMAEKLLEYKDNRDELIKIVYGMDRQFINYIKDNGGNDYPDIDPFSVFSIFNRTSTEERRKEICKYFREKLKLTARTPDDFDSIPLMNPKMSVFVWREDIQTGIQPIWNLFSSILSEEQSNDFAHSFDTVIKQRGIKWNLTMALFWIRPHDFIPLDTNSREYLAKIGIEVFDEKNLTAENYLNLIKKIKSKIENNEIKEKSFPEISFNAWKKDAISIGDPTMTQDNTLLDKYTKLLRNTHNLILTGAPGTGKTFMAKKLAEKMGCTPDEIGFVQFHPSYDYTDFVEGLRPVQDESGSGQIGFERKDGVFKEFCAGALQNLVDSRKSVDVLQHEKTINEIVEDFLNDAVSKKTQFETITKNVFYVDSFTDRKVLVSIPQNEKVKTLPVSLDDILELMSNNVQLDIGKDVSEYFNRKWRTQQDSYIYVLTKQLQEIVRKNKNNTASTIEKVQAKNFVFIIDEINRGEVSKIFGELFYSVDSGYRVSAQDLEAVRAKEKQFTTIKTQYANLETTGNAFDRALGSADYGHFFIPENVFIIGTMNDIDRSVESMDFAFRRRFTWVEVKAEDTQYMLDEKVDEKGQTRGLPDGLAQEAKKRMNRLNEAISKISGLNEAYHIGASYFLKLNEYDGDFNKLFKKLWDYHIKGILEEYVRGHPNKTDLMEKFKSAYSDGTTE